MYVANPTDINILPSPDCSPENTDFPVHQRLNLSNTASNQYLLYCDQPTH